MKEAPATVRLVTIRKDGKGRPRQVMMEKTMSNIDYSAKHIPFASSRTAKQKVQLVLNVAVISAAFLFVAAAVLGIFP